MPLVTSLVMVRKALPERVRAVLARHRLTCQRVARMLAPVVSHRRSPCCRLDGLEWKRFPLKANSDVRLQTHSIGSRPFPGRHHNRKLAAYSIISSVRVSSVEGISRPGTRSHPDQLQRGEGVIIAGSVTDDDAPSNDLLFHLFETIKQKRPPRRKAASVSQLLVNRGRYQADGGRGLCLGRGHGPS